MTASVLAPALVQVAVPGSPTLPQVNLLPPEIRAGRQLTNVKAWLGLALLIALLVAATMVVWSQLTLRNTESALAKTEDTNQSLLGQQGQYAEVPAVLNRLAAVEEARMAGMSTETLWRPYLMAIAATAPAGVSITTFAVTQPGDIASPTPGDVAETVVALVSFEAESATLPDTAGWLDGLASVTGLSDPWFNSAQLRSENDVVHFVVTGTVSVTVDGLALRFLPTGEVD